MALNAMKNLKGTQSQLGRVWSDEAVFTRKFRGVGGPGMQRSKHRWAPSSNSGYISSGIKPQSCKRLQESRQTRSPWVSPACSHKLQPGLHRGAGHVLMWGPLPHTGSLQAAAAHAQPLHNAHCFGVTPQPPEIQRNRLGMDSVEMRLLQLISEAASEIVHHYSPVIPLQMATAAAAFGGEFSVLLLVHPESV